MDTTIVAGITLALFVMLVMCTLITVAALGLFVLFGGMWKIVQTVGEIMQGALLLITGGFFVGAYFPPVLSGISNGAHMSFSTLVLILGPCILIGLGIAVMLHVSIAVFQQKEEEEEE